jgi:hypothetical protein
MLSSEKVPTPVRIDPELHAAGLAMIKAQGGIFGWVTDSTKVLAALSSEEERT